MQTTIHALIDQYNTTENEIDQRFLKNQIHLHYYQASAAERAAVQKPMQPFLNEIEREMIEKDPIARQTYEMFKRFEASKVVADDDIKHHTDVN